MANENPTLDVAQLEAVKTGSFSPDEIATLQAAADTMLANSGSKESLTAALRDLPDNERIEALSAIVASSIVGAVDMTIKAAEAGVTPEIMVSMGFVDGLPEVSEADLNVFTLSKRAKRYVAENGAEIIDDGYHSLIVSPDGVMFFQVEETGGTQIYETEAYSFTDFADGSVKTFKMSKDRQTAQFGELEGFAVTNIGIPQSVMNEKGKVSEVNVDQHHVKFFKTDEGPAVLIHGRSVYLSDDGKDFVVATGAEELRVLKKSVIFENPHTGEQGKFNILDDEATLNGVAFIAAEVPNSIEAAKTPEVRENEYSFTLPGDEQLIVTASKYNRSYSSFKLFIDGREIPWSYTEGYPVTRFRDGGTTIIYTTEGTLFVPAPRNVIKHGTKPTWNDQEIVDNES